MKKKWYYKPGLSWERRKKFLLVFLLNVFLFFGVQAQTHRVTLNVKETSLEQVIKELEKQTGLQFFYSQDKIEKITGLSLQAKQEDFKTILDRLLKNTVLTFTVMDDVVVIKDREKTVSPLQSAIREIKGVVTDVQGNTLPGVTVRIKGTTLGGITDTEGAFQLSLPEGEAVLQFSFVGMKPLEVVLGNQEFLRVKLEEEKVEMDEVVVTGIFRKAKSSYTGAATVVTGEELKQFGNRNLLTSLRNIDPSFNIVENNEFGSNPNRLPEIQIRGNSSLPNVDQLKDETRVSMNTPLVVLDGFETSLEKLLDINENEVEAITLLKDASATAIYGSRAANGVIVIESKTPKPGRIWVTYGGELRIETPDLTGYNLMDAREKLDAELKGGVYTYGGETLEKWRLYQSKLREVLAGVNTYWLDKPLQTSIQQRHTVTLEGGDEALRYRMYVGYNNSPGVMKDSKRDVLTGSLDFQYRLKKVLLKNSITLDNSVANESPWGSFSEYTRLNPYLRPYGEDGEIQKRLDNFEGIGGDSNYLNPMYNTTFNSKDQSKNFAVRELFKVEYNPTEELRLEGAFSLSKSVGHRDIFRPAQHTAFDDVTDPTLRGDYRRSQSESVSWGVDLTGSWNKQLRDHYLTANARMSVLENTSETFGNYVTGFPNDNMDNLLFGKKYNEKVTGLESTSRSIGWVAAGGYSYKYKYSFDFNIRLDGSSQFGKDNRWAPFWSTGLRWDLKKENFLKNVSFISDLILRGTYGTTGSQGFDPYQAHGYYTYANLLLPYYSSDATGSEILAMHNESLKWQTTKSTNLALELGLFDQRFTARIEYYRKITDNMITQVSLAPSVGFPQYPENIGKIENKGWEISLSAIPYKNTAKQAYWTIMVNGSHNADKLLKISEAMKHMNDQNSLKLKDMPLPRYEEGESLSRIWVVRSLGIDPASGDEILLKRNGEMTSAVNWNANDVVPIGNTEPKWQGYINSSFTYMGWGADVSFRYQFGGQVYNQTLLDKVENANLKYNADRRVSQLRWMNPGDKAQFRAINSTGWETKATSRFIMDENVFQGSSLSVYYRMDRTNTKFIGHWGLSSAKVSFNMEDFFYLSTVKRERGLYYPYSRQFTFSLNVGF